MSARTFLLEPVDTWFFRDGRPYNLHEANQTAVPSLFPPHPPTVLGALRAALARGLGWRDGGPWPHEICTILGNGRDLGALRFRGPYLTRDAQRGLDAMLWPLPAHVLGLAGKRERWEPQAMLVPGDEPVLCDQGRVRLPEVVPGGAGQVNARVSARPGAWVGARGMAEILAGRLPEAGEVIEELWEREIHVGIKRDERARTTAAVDHALYSPLMIRARPGLALVAELAGLPEEVADPAALLPLGGESRLAACRAMDARLPALPCPVESIRRTGRLVVVHLAPARVSRLPGPGEPVPGLPGTRVVFACLPPPLQIGGWDGVRGRPLALAPHVAPGSVWFCEMDDHGRALDAVLARHDQHIGEQDALGFGHIVLGAWPEGARPERGRRDA